MSAFLKGRAPGWGAGWYPHQRGFRVFGEKEQSSEGGEDYCYEIAADTQTRQVEITMDSERVTTAGAGWWLAGWRGVSTKIILVHGDDLGTSRNRNADKVCLWSQNDDRPALLCQLLRCLHSI